MPSEYWFAIRPSLETSKCEEGNLLATDIEWAIEQSLMFPYVYLPNPTVSTAVASIFNQARFIAVGMADINAIPGVECLSLRKAPPGLDSGTHIFNTEIGIIVVGVVSSRPPLDFRFVLPASDDEIGSLQDRFGFAEFLLTAAAPMTMPSKYQNGERVRIRGRDQIFQIDSSHEVDGNWYYKVTFGGKTSDVLEGAIVAKVGDSLDPAEWIEGECIDSASLATAITTLKLDNLLTDHIYSVGSSLTHFMAHQFIPVIKFLQGRNRRILIADEVGLGKTIEAGLIWNELEHRGVASRVLIVCPSPLVEKWRDEMANRFDRLVDRFSKDTLEALIETSKRGDPSKPISLVASMQKLRTPQILETLASNNIHFDLVIVDEAHYLRNSNTRAHTMGTLLSSISTSMVLLSATPVNLHSDDLFNLLKVLDPGQFADRNNFEAQLMPTRVVNKVAASLLKDHTHPGNIANELKRIEESKFGKIAARLPEYREALNILASRDVLTSSDLVDIRRLILDLSNFSSIFTRTRKAQLSFARAVRRPTSIQVEWNSQDAEIYRCLWKWLYLKAQIKRIPPNFLAQMPLRMASSSMPAAVRYLKGRIEDDDLKLDEFDDDLIDPDDELEGAAYANFSSSTLAAKSKGENLDILEFYRRRVLEAMNAYDFKDPKLDKLKAHLGEALRVGDGRVMIFSYFKTTIEYLAEHLHALYSVETITGDTPPEERYAKMRSFRKGEFQILIISEVGTEGLDFEFCNAMFNYDLPWNPMKVEQRIGRLDRYGQAHEVIHIFNFAIAGTIDNAIFDRLYERIKVFEESVGELEPILGELATKDLVSFVLDPDLSDAEKQKKLKNLELAILEDEHRVTDIRNAQELLQGTDELIIEGFEQERMSKGNFVGQPEIETLVRRFLGANGFGKLVPSKHHPSCFDLIGSDELAAVISKQGSRSRKIDVNRLAAEVRDEIPVTVTFSSEASIETLAQLITIQHPIAKGAQKYFVSQLSESNRMGALEINHPTLSGEYLVVIYLVEVSGYEKKTLLMPFSINRLTRELSTEPGYALLAAITRSAYVDWNGFSRDEAHQLLPPLRDFVFSWHKSFERDQASSNAVRLEQRRESIIMSFDRQISTNQATIDREPGNRIVPALKANIRDLEWRKEHELERIDSIGDVSVLLSSVLAAQLLISESPNR